MIKNMINGHAYVGFHVSNNEFDKDEYFGSGSLFNLRVEQYGKKNL